MADMTIAPRSPLAGHVAAGRFGRRDGEAGVVVSEIIARSIAAISVRKGRREALAQAVEQAFSLILPDTPRRITANGMTVQWNGPGRWFVMADMAPAGGIEARLAVALGEHASIVDQSHAFLQLRLVGPNARGALAKGVPLDLHPRAFKPGDAAQTSVAHVNVALAQIDERPTYEILTPRSSALSFWHWLEASAGEFGLTVETSAQA